ncbi:hypothetical protein VTN49DRAFT_8088 [Thermomyces lanuginosus]|uniref:uncharacterized protein n=1 Tax=Thermomyces lanuginosus TaxID=5541 RepID=UPI003742E49C
MPLPQREWEPIERNPLLDAERRYNRPEEERLADDNYARFNSGQRAAFDAPERAHFYLNGPSGRVHPFGVCYGDRYDPN